VQNKAIRRAIEALATNPETIWTPAKEADGELTGSEVAETTYHFATRDLRLIVRRQRKATGEQLSFDDLRGFRFFALTTNVPPILASAIDVEHHHRLRGGPPEEAIRQLVHDCGMNHAPLQSFMANWLWWLASALAYNVARWVRVLALPEAFRTSRGKRLRASFLNVPARIVRSAPYVSVSVSHAPIAMPRRSSPLRASYGRYRPSPDIERAPPAVTSKAAEPCLRSSSPTFQRPFGAHR